MSTISPHHSSDLSPRNEYLSVASKKVYLAPLKEQLTNSTVIYINFNENIRNQLFPEYLDKVFHNICTKSQYDDLINEIKDFFTIKKSNRCNFCYNCLFCFCYSCDIYGKNIQHMTNIIQKHIKQWKFCTLINVICSLTQKPIIGKNKIHGTGYNYMGEPLYENPIDYYRVNTVSVTDRITMTDDNDTSTSNGNPELLKPYAVWPPKGYNIILKFEGEYLRNNWLRQEIINFAHKINTHRNIRH